MSIQKIICYAVFSEETSNFLTLALASDKTKSFSIVGFLVNSVNREDLTVQEEKMLTVIQDFLVILGGVMGDNVTNKKGEVFAYYFSMANKQGPIEWFSTRSSMNLSYEELKKSNVSKAKQLSSKTYLQLLHSVSPSEEVEFVGVKDRIIRNVMNNNEQAKVNCVLPLSEEFILLALDNGKLELWDTNEDSFKNITIYGEKDNIDNVVIKLEKIYSHPKTLNTKFIALTEKGDVFIIKIQGNLFPEVNKLELLGAAKSISVDEGTILIALINGDLNLIDSMSNNIYLNLTLNTLYPVLFAKIKRGILNFVVLRDGIYYFKRFRIATRELLDTIDLGNSIVKGLAVLSDMVLVSSYDGVIRFISDNVKNIEIEDVNSISKMVKVPHSKRVLIFPQSGSFELLTLPGKVTSLDNSNRYSMSSYCFLDSSRVIIGGKTGEIEIYNIDTSKIEYSLQQLANLSTLSKGDAIINISILSKNKIVSINRAGQIIIWK